MKFEIDNFLASDPDVQTFGINLACSWPLPSPLDELYKDFILKVGLLDQALYVYPYSETHITIMTLVSFKDVINPGRVQREELERLIDEVIICLRPVFDDPNINSVPIRLCFDKVVLTSKAAYLLFSDQLGRINYLRSEIAKILAKKLPHLHPIFPDIVHCTFLRFQGMLSAIGLAEKLDSFASQLKPATIEVPEILLTTETSPYMRSGQIKHIFRCNGKT